MNRWSVIRSKKRWIEAFCAVVGIAIVFSLMLPKFLSVQTSGQIAEIQKTLDAIIQKMIDRPETFIDITIAEGGKVREQEKILVNGVVHFSSMYPVFTMNWDEIKKILPDYQPSEREKDLTFHFMGGHISATEEIMRKRTWNWNKHYVVVYVNVYGPDYDPLEYGKKHPTITYPSAKYLYDSSNGLESAGVLYAHSLDWYLAGKTLD